MSGISIGAAFTAGILSFLSPCIVPLVPVYLASLYGQEIFDAGAPGRRLPVFLHALSFVIGFTLVFTALGAIAGLTGFAINPDPALLNKISGSLLIAFGVFMLAALKVPWLNYERRLNPSLGKANGYLRSLIIGAVFSLAWTPCVGPILGSILTLALTSETAWSGAYLLAIYSLGLGLPFLIIGAAFDALTPLLKRIRRYSRIIYIVSSLLLITVGVLTLTNSLAWLSSLTA